MEKRFHFVPDRFGRKELIWLKDEAHPAEVPTLLLLREAKELRDMFLRRFPLDDEEIAWMASLRAATAAEREKQLAGLGAAEAEAVA